MFSLWFLLLCLFFLHQACVDSFTFAPSSHRPRRFLLASSTTTDGDWIYLTDDKAIKKRVIVQGTGDLPSNDDDDKAVTIHYRGTLAQDAWSSLDVVEYWLKEQQGLDHLVDAFLKNNVDGETLVSDNFDETFVASSLGVSNKIQCKKIVMAAKRLAKDRSQYAIGTEFDSSSRESGPYSLTLGKKSKVIQCTKLAVSSMQVGEVCEVIARSDYCYGKEGLRSRAGEVIVPPFATLRFEIERLS